MSENTDSRPAAMEIEVVRRVCLARHLYELGAASLRTSNDVHLFSAVNLMQDAVEAFLVAIAEHVGAKLNERTDFDKYFVEINAKITPRELPFKQKLLRLNRLRVESKHYGIQPARDECERFAVTVRDFFDEVTMGMLGASFSTISALDLLDDGEVKSVLIEAREALEKRDFQTMAVSCRKVLYLEIEKDYNIYKFREGAGTCLGDELLGKVSSAPYYTQNPEYIEKHVKSPTDYIALDHSRVDADLLKKGVRPEEFWNIWRLTPGIIRNEDSSWTFREEFDKLGSEHLAEHAEYIFSTTVDLALSIHTTRRSIRWQTGNRQWTLPLKSDGVPVYDKADNTSNIAGRTPIGVTEVSVMFRTPGLKGDGHYYQVMYFAAGSPFLYGFVHEGDVDLE
jgi:hypothetical protein